MGSEGLEEVPTPTPNALPAPPPAVIALPAPPLAVIALPAPPLAVIALPAPPAAVITPPPVHAVEVTQHGLQEKEPTRSGIGAKKTGWVVKAKSKQNVSNKVKVIGSVKSAIKSFKSTNRDVSKDCPSRQSKAPQKNTESPRGQGAAYVGNGKLDGARRDVNCTGRTPSQGGSQSYRQNPPQGAPAAAQGRFQASSSEKPGHHQGGKHNGRNLPQGGKKDCQTHQDGRNSGRNPAQGGNHQRGDGGKPRLPGYRELEELSLKDPSEVVLVVANTRKGYYDLLKGPLKPDFMILVVKILAKICEVDFKENKTSVLASACNPHFLENLAYYIATIPTDTHKTRKKGVQSFMRDVFMFCGTVIKLLPNTACEYLGPTLMLVKNVMTSASAFQSITFARDLTEKQAELETLLKKLMEEREKKPVKESSRNETLKHQPPPDDFRELSIFPLPDDILTREKAFVRPNIIDGAYDSIEHYLDVQFRLLREDFVWPLRDGITDYMQQIAVAQKPNRKMNNIRIYQNVTFLHSTVERDKVGFVVLFDTKSTSFVNWEHSKRFMYGSLLCFTHDNFASIMFGTVLDRKVENLKYGRISVELTQESEMLDLFHSKFTMVESEVYFEPYYHVLKALQVMKADVFPMSRYIVDVQPETNPPLYTAQSPHYLYDIQDFQVPVLDDDAWPIAEDLAFDNSQYRAFKAALTKEFVVIQGPPGTGKTYVGLKIASTIINNIKHIVEGPQRPIDQLFERRPRHSPLLVVCFTNHALDQFLEGLLPTTTNMIRVGGQSRSEVLKEYNLREKRYAHKRQSDMYRLTKNIHERMSALMSDVKGIQEDIERLDSNYGLVSLMSIKEVYHHANVSCFLGDNGKLDDNLFLDWLVNMDDMFAPLEEVLLEEDAPEEEGDDTGPEEHPEEMRDVWNQAPRDGFDLDEVPVNGKLKFFVSLPSEREAANKLRAVKAMLKEEGDPRLETKLWMLEVQARQHNYISNRLKMKSNYNNEAARRLMEWNVYLWRLTSDQRWNLYFAWVAQLRTALLEELRAVEVRYRAEAVRYQETRHMEDLQLIRNADVVGMTTTGASRLQPLLQALKCRVVIVEEAAEVMESHIVVSLTNHCQHLILIGDHQQLRPTTAVYKLARDFHFDISLFERMLRNGLHCEILNVQHRMRPEIARLIVPSIYKELYDHESVLHYKPVQGVSKSLFFLSHKNKEQEIGETHSRRNTFEADLLLRLCQYLLLQGYPPERITILTTYSGQMFYMRNERKKSLALKDVQMTIVDNFQGEENDIILLSLVRNNDDNNIGFLKTENRVCVALSRAKHGMFIMGNMDNLTSSSSVWPRIKEVLAEQKAVGDFLTLQCPVHKEQLTEVRVPDDFNKVPEGGCQLPCATTLACGHICVRVCHAADREHKLYDCREPCTRTPPKCGLQHPCPKLCGADCGDCKVLVERQLPCDHSKLLPCYVDHITYKCWQKVNITSPDCGHTFLKPCHQDVDSCVCPFPCDIRLDCGHTCARTCHVRDDPDHELYKCRKACPKMNKGCTQEHMCARKCHETCGTCCVPMKKKAPTCDHVYTVLCSLKEEDIVCEQRCEKTLPCGHPCRLLCWEECGNCQVMVKKIVSDSDCNHEVTVKCCEKPQRRHCPGPCQRSMSCGHRCNRPCKVVCSDSSTCQELVKNSVRPACGHDFQVYCKVAALAMAPDSPQLLKHCRQPCNAELQCGHRCKGTCGLCLQGRVHQGCRAQCGRIQICGHACSVPCAQACPPCRKKCRMRCQHNRCNRDCGEPCARCQEPCNWRCAHKRCTKRCWQPCNREPCNEPCKKMLPCKHPCIGFCGEPCPRLCRECDRDEVENIVFGQEDEPDARFVYLLDCRHTIESRALETWLTQRRVTDGISMPQCPLCKTNITTTMRYMNSIKQVLKDIFEIKKKLFGEFQAIENGRTRLVQQLMELYPTPVEAAVEQRRPVPIRQQPRMRYLLGQRVLAAQAPARPAVPVKVLTGCGKDLFYKLKLRLEGEGDYNEHSRRRRRFNLSSVDLESVRIQLQIFQEVQKSLDEALPYVESTPRQTVMERADVILSALVRRDRMSAQEVSDLNLEIRRFHRVTHLCRLESVMRKQSASAEAPESYEKARNIAYSILKYSPEQDILLAEHIRALNDATKANMRIIEEERRKIVTAIGMPRGHWFKCPNNHFYVIADCGGANQVGKCPECGVAIGGLRYRLEPGNRLAPEMDGASNSAWPGSAMNP